MSSIDTAKLFFGVVLNRLQDSFPAAVYLSAQDIWPEFEKVANGGTHSVVDRRSYRALAVSELAEDEQLKEQYTKQMLRWMAREGYLVSDPVTNFPYDYVLSSKALAALNIPIDKERKTIGEALANAVLQTGEAAKHEIIAQLVGRIFDSFSRFIP